MAPTRLRSRLLDVIGGYDAVEAGLVEPGATIKATEFVGRAALVAALDRDPVARLCTLVLEDAASPAGIPRYMVGGEPVTSRDGTLLIDAKGRRSFVTSAGAAPTLGRHLLNAYLPVEHARIGAQLAVEYFGDRYPVAVLSIAADPLVAHESAGVGAGASVPGVDEVVGAARTT